MNKRTYYFHHIPKTAGMSITAWIRTRGRLRFCPDGLWNQLLRRDVATLGDFDFFAGHFYTGLADYLNRDLITLTFLRHPVERSISHYLHIMRDQEHYLHQHAQRLGSFRAFMEDPQTVPMLYNFQTRALAMEFDVTALQKTLPNPDNSPYAVERHIESSLDGYASAVYLPRAMEYLDGCCFVGITEHMEDSLSELQRVLGDVGEPGPPPKLNSAANQSDLGPLSRDEYKHLLQLLTDDIALYEYAKFGRRQGVGSGGRPAISTSGRE
jgi:hypothetical protein